MAKLDVEAVKRESDRLRGTIAAELAAPTDKFGERDAQLLKFHGIYQQDDRDSRKDGREYAFMVRTRNPGGFLPAAFYLAIDELADRHGNGTLRVTTRGALQLHGVRKTNLKATIADIAAHVGSTLAACGDVNRNVMAPPWPYTGAAYAEARRLAREIVTLLEPKTRAYVEIWQDGERVDGAEDEPIYGDAYLPRKFKISVTVPGDNSVDIFAQDLGVIVHVDDAGRVEGYDLTAGGGLGTTHRKPETFPRLADPIGFVTPDKILDAVRAVVLVQRDFGDRTNRRHARLKYTIADRGVAWFRAEVERVGEFRFEPFRFGGTWELPRSFGWHEQGDGRWFYGQFVRAGRVGGALKRALREIVAQLGVDLVATPQQDLLITGVRDEQRARVDAILAGAGVEPAQAIDRLDREALACPALPTCGLALAESERGLPGLLGGIRGALAEAGLADEPVAVRVTGCPNGCARPFLAEIGIVGTSAGRYNLYLGGDAGSTRLNALFRENVPVDEIPATLKPVFTAFRFERHDGERFGDWCHRGLAAAVQT